MHENIRAEIAAASFFAAKAEEKYRHNYELSYVLSMIAHAEIRLQEAKRALIVASLEAKRSTP